MSLHFPFVILISANSEWQEVLTCLQSATVSRATLGEFLIKPINGEQDVFFHSGWGKISSAAVTQFAIQNRSPELIINLGTCGGLEGLAKIGETLLVDQTMNYDVIESMSDYTQALNYYSCKTDYFWIKDPLPKNTRRALLISADQDIQPKNFDLIAGQFHATCADWESNAIAWVANRNHIPWIILRSVSDLVGRETAETSGNVDLWRHRLPELMRALLETLPWYLSQFQENYLATFPRNS